MHHPRLSGGTPTQRACLPMNMSTTPRCLLAGVGTLGSRPRKTRSMTRSMLRVFPENPGIPAQQMQRTGNAQVGLRGRAQRHTLANHAQTHSRKQYHQAHTRSPASKHPGTMQKPGSPAQQIKSTGTRERACGSGTGQNPLAEHAQHAPQPRSIAWGGGGEAAIKGGAPCFLRESFWTRSSNGSSDVVTFYS